MDGITFGASGLDRAAHLRRQADRLAEALGVPARFVEGRRVTDAGALEVSTMVLIPEVAQAVSGSGVPILAAGGIVAGQRLLHPLVSGAATGVRAVASALGVTVSAQLGTLPVVARAFGLVPLAGPLVSRAGVSLIARQMPSSGVVPLGVMIERGPSRPQDISTTSTASSTSPRRGGAVAAFDSRSRTTATSTCRPGPSSSRSTAS